MKQNIFFIVGTGRCGTQMLRNLLSSYNNIAILPETHFITPLYKKHKLNKINCEEFLEVIDNVYSAAGEKWIKVILRSAKKNYFDYKKKFKNFVKFHNVQGSIKDFIEAFYYFLYGNKYLIGDKTPHYGANLEIILEIWPNAKIINLQRDGINTALSMQRHPAFIKDINGKINFKDIGIIKSYNIERNFSNKTPTKEDALLFWKKSINQIDKSIEASRKLHSLKILEIKYEDLIYDTKKTFNLIIDHLGLKKNNFLLLKTVCKIKPFASYKNSSRISIDHYKKLYNIVKFEMKNHNYPYLINKKNNFFYEILRTAGYYFFSLLKIFNKIWSKILR
jgi:hypothetical protein